MGGEQERELLRGYPDTGIVINRDFSDGSCILPFGSRSA
jgi:hypothetical protein